MVFDATAPTVHLRLIGQAAFDTKPSTEMTPSSTRRTWATLTAAAGACLALTGYAVTSGNLIIWKYLGQTPSQAQPYTSAGVPAHAGYSVGYPEALPVPGMPADYMTRVGLMLPEKVDIRSNTQVALGSDDQTNIKLGAAAEVWVTFLNEGAGFLNGVGFFTYDPSNPPASPADVTDEQIILPNASVPPLAVAGTQGATVYLGKFPAGRAIGFFVAANGWSASGRTLNGNKVPGVKESLDRNWIYYSLKGLNPEPADSRNLNQHTVLLQDTTLTGSDNNTYQRMVLGFEDYLRTSGSDHDFNDVLLAVHVSPSTAISNLAGIPKLVATTKDGDADGDGVKDSVDEFPADPNAAFSRWFPGSSSWGTLAFEDNWPQKGDYDLNDVVVRYRSRELLSATRLVSGLEMDMRLDARGGVYHSGFALALPGIDAAQIQSAILTLPSGATVSIKPLTGQTKAVFEIMQDTYDHAPAGSGNDVCAVYYNTGTGCPVQASAVFKLSVRLVAPVGNFPAAPYDPFIFRTGQTGIEVHLPGNAPSSRADTSLFGTGDDGSTLGTTKTYMTANRLPWALHVPSEWAYPAEFVDTVRPFPSIVDWAASGGTVKTDWYVVPTSPALSFINGR